MPLYDAKKYPERFIELKKSIIGDEAKVTQAWADLLAALKDATVEYASKGPSMIPVVEFDQLETLDSETTNLLRRRGCVLIRNVVPDEEALSWEQQLREYIRDNPGVVGYPPNNKQFFHVYWSKPQVAARSHPNLVAAQKWLNKFWHPSSAEENQDFMKGVDLDQPLTYADRFRIRKADKNDKWTFLSPHIDGGSIERWEDITMRKSFESILQGDWKSFDAFTLDGRINAQTDLYRRANQCSMWRTWQGWLSMSSTGPGEGTIRFFPDLLLSTAYIILRPFFSPVVDPAKFESGEADIWDPKFWKFDVSKADFPGIAPLWGETGFHGPAADEESHPHLKTDSTMCSAPHVNPGDMVFWHCDLLHSVETYHTGPTDSSVMYIPAVPTTPNNLAYVQLQKEHFLKGLAGPDFPQSTGESKFRNVAKEEDLKGDSRVAMGFTAGSGRKTSTVAGLYRKLQNLVN